MIKFVYWEVADGEPEPDTIQEAWAVIKIKDKKLLNELNKFRHDTVFLSPSYPEKHPLCNKLAERFNEQGITNMITRDTKCSINRSPLYSNFDSAWVVTIEGWKKPNNNEE